MSQDVEPYVARLVAVIDAELMRQKAESSLYYEVARKPDKTVDYVAVDGNVDLYALAREILAELDRAICAKLEE